MFTKNFFLIYIVLIMISFFNKTEAKYEKLFFDFNIKSINGELINFSTYKDKTILLVNVASNCGFTKQYKGLEELYDKFKSKGFIVIGVPSNQFGGQEPGSNKEIKNFCKTNFNISFPLTDKVDVIGEDAHPIYEWAKNNYGNSAIPKWNFHKILINRSGKIEDTYKSFTNPQSEKIISKIEKILN